ncbi:TPA: molybdopterin cofactor-binding domain-containing protein, partial [Vibrio cholerae O1]
AFGILFQDQPALCSDRVRYIGDAVAAVAAIDAETAERALALIRVDYRPLPLVEDMAAALAPGAPPVHASGNLVTEVGLSRGDLAAGFAAAVHVVEDTYVTPRQMHGFMETEGGWAAPEGEGLIVCAGGQHGARDRMQLARILALPEERIRVVTSPTGGAFGGKDELTVQPALALLALKARAPVRLHLSRAESVLAGTKRNPFVIRMRTGCDAEGRLVAQEVEALADSGAYASLSPGVLETAMEHAAGPYRVANIRTRGRLAYTNNGTGGAFRGFGANQMSYAIECQIDRLAALCGLDPVEIRRRNLRRAGEPGFLGQKVAPTEKLSEMLDIAAASDLWAPAAARPDEVTGTGIALNYQ